MNRNIVKKLKKNKWEILKSNSEKTVEEPQSTQDFIPINSVEQNGVFEIENNRDAHLFDRVYKFTDINYTTKDNSEREDILIRYCEILNGLSLSFKIIIANLPRYIKEMEDIYIKKENQNDIEKEFSEIYNSIIDEKLNNEISHIDQSKYLVLTVHRKTSSEASAFFEQTELQLVDEFHGLGSELIEVDGIERLNILYRAFRADPQCRFSNIWNEDIKNNYKKMIAVEKIVPIDDVKKQYLQMGEKYVCTMVIKKNGYPSRLSNKFMNHMNTLTYPSVITLDITPIPQDMLTSTLIKKLDSVEIKIENQQRVRNKNEQYSSEISRNVQKEKKNIKKYLDEVSENDQTMFFTQLLITVYADTEEELESHIEDITLIGKKYLLNITPYYLQQEEAFLTSLPIGGRYVNNMMRTLFTNALVSLAPFNVQEIHHREGKYYGTNLLSRKLVYGDRRLLMNGNGWIFGVSGTGKSMFMKMEIGQTLAGTNDDVVIIDPLNEYEDYIRTFNGQYINLSSKSRNYVNPLEIDFNLKQDKIMDFIATKSDFIMTILMQMTESKLNLQAKSCVDKAARNMYLKIFSTDKKHWNSPTLVDLNKSLRELGSDIAIALADSLYTFTEGSLNLFSHQSNVQSSNRLIAYGTKDLGEQLRPLAMLIMLENIRTQLTNNQLIGIPTWVYCDEAHELTKEEYTAHALERSFKEVRKQGGIMTGVTQNPPDLFRNDTTKNMISNSEFIMMLNQSELDISEIDKIVNISVNERKYLRTGKKGVGLLRFGNNVMIPLDGYVEKEKFPKLYELFNTDFHEKIKEGKFENKSLND